MIKTHKQRRRRGVILTRSGLKKLQDATTEAQIRDNHGYRYTQETLGELTGLDPDTVFKVYAAKAGVDKRTLTRCFKGFNLKLESSDYCCLDDSEKTTEIKKSYVHCTQDWGKAPDVSHFYGRHAELVTLTHWIEDARCRIVTLLGSKGIGTTSLGVKLAQQLQDKFDHVIWRSLSDYHSVEDFLSELLHCLSNECLSTSSSETTYLISLLLQSLRDSRCLLILDDLDLVLLKEQQRYQNLFKCLGETSHQSCLFLISHAKPKVVKLLEGESLPIRVLHLKGLESQEAIAILKDKGCRCSHSQEDWSQIIQFYGGNPLFLKLLATTIQTIFNGMIREFIACNTPIFGEIRYLLDQQFEALDQAQKMILLHLAISPQSLCFSQLREQLAPSLSPQLLLESLEELQERSLIEPTRGFFLIPPFLKIYLLEQLTNSKLSENLTPVSFPSPLPLSFAVS